MDAAQGVRGVHGSGHFSLGGIELDVFVSPSDPMFWLHHAQIDRLWAIWQGQDLRGRTRQVWGTGTNADSESFFPLCHFFKGGANMHAVPPSPNVTLDTPINFGVISPPKPIGDIVSSVDKDLCYIYE
jgi:tyrosinase